MALREKTSDSLAGQAAAGLPPDRADAPKGQAFQAELINRFFHPRSFFLNRFISEIRQREASFREPIQVALIGLVVDDIVNAPDKIQKLQEYSRIEPFQDFCSSLLEKVEALKEPQLSTRTMVETVGSAARSLADTLAQMVAEKTIQQTLLECMGIQWAPGRPGPTTELRTGDDTPESLQPADQSRGRQGPEEPPVAEHLRATLYPWERFQSNIEEALTQIKEHLSSLEAHPEDRKALSSIEDAFQNLRELAMIQGNEGIEALCQRIISLIKRLPVSKRPGGPPSSFLTRMHEVIDTIEILNQKGDGSEKSDLVAIMLRQLDTLDISSSESPSEQGSGPGGQSIESPPAKSASEEGPPEEFAALAAHFQGPTQKGAAGSESLRQPTRPGDELFESIYDWNGLGEADLMEEPPGEGEPPSGPALSIDSPSEGRPPEETPEVEIPDELDEELQSLVKELAPETSQEVKESAGLGGHSPDAEDATSTPPVSPGGLLESPESEPSNFLSEADIYFDLLKQAFSFLKRNPLPSRTPSRTPARSEGRHPEGTGEQALTPLSEEPLAGQAPSIRALEDIELSCYSLKILAQKMGYPEIAKIAKRIEEVISKALSGEIALTPQIVGYMADVCQQMEEVARDGKSSSEDIAKLLSEISSFLETAQKAQAGPLGGEPGRLAHAQGAGPGRAGSPLNRQASEEVRESQSPKGAEKPESKPSPQKGQTEEDAFDFLLLNDQDMGRFLNELLKDDDGGNP